MTSTDFPRVCSVCRKLKAVYLGKLRRGFKYNSWVFTCHACLEKPAVYRQRRHNNETPPEREVRQWLEQHDVAATAEFKVGQFIFDFALTKLGMLIELDSSRYHKHLRHKLRDGAKDKVAANEYWVVRRIKVGPHMLLDLERAILDRKAALGK
jgi:very-short-patch-repair endonuclease